MRDNSLRHTVDLLRRFVSLRVESVRLDAAERITLLLTAVAYHTLVMVLAAIALVFVSLGIGHLLAVTVAPHFAYLIVGAFYILLIVLLAVFKRTLLLNPICRMITKLIVAPPKSVQHEDQAKSERTGAE